MTKKATPTRCALYLRVSLDATGEQLAVTRQREDCQAIAQARGWPIVEEFVDNSASASDKSKDRPAYNRLVTAYAAGGFDALICYDLDRLTRQPRQLEDWIDAAEERGLKLVTANGEADLSTDGGRLFARIKASVARAEVERKSARQTRAALQRSERGKPPKGVRLTGYDTDGDVIPEEAQRVRAVFERFYAGDSIRGITAWLQESGAPTRKGGTWHPSTIRETLVNPRYAGRAIYQGEVTGRAGGWEPLVDEAVFDVIQAKLSDPRRRTQVGTDRKHLGGGLYLCGVCGRTVRSHTGKRYRCPEGGHITRLQASIDNCVIRLTRERLGRPDVANALRLPESESARAMARTVADFRARLVQIESDYDAGLIDGRRFAVAVEKVRAQLGSAETAMVRMHANHEAASILSAADPVAAFDMATLGSRRAVVDFLMLVRLDPWTRGHKFDPESVRIEWRTP